MLTKEEKKKKKKILSFCLMNRDTYKVRRERERKKNPGKRNVEMNKKK
jgi:hypothetical protein